MEKIWVVKRSNGEIYVLYKEPIEGVQKWAFGQDVVVYEYALVGTVYPGAAGKK